MTTVEFALVCLLGIQSLLWILCSIHDYTPPADRDPFGEAVRDSMRRKT